MAQHCRILMSSSCRRSSFATLPKERSSSWKRGLALAEARAAILERRQVLRELPAPQVSSCFTAVDSTQSMVQFSVEEPKKQAAPWHPPAEVSRGIRQQRQQPISSDLPQRARHRQRRRTSLTARRARATASCAHSRRRRRSRRLFARPR